MRICFNFHTMMKLALSIPVAFKNTQGTFEKDMNILAGDIGGTKANLLLSRFTTNGLITIKETRFVSKDHNNFHDILLAFLEGQPQPDKICLSVAGPVIDGKVKFTNLSWQIDGEEISQHFGSIPVAILNDLESTAYGLAGLRQDELSILCKGNNEATGNIAILAAGTGLGEAGLYFDGKEYHPFATEGGHCDFAPRSLRDVEVLNFLLKRHEHVSWERLLSGNGIFTIWQFLTEVEKKDRPEWLLKQMENTDPAPIISKAALEKTCAVCVETIEMFNRYLAIEAVNLILKLKAAGGLYLAGGIAPKLLPLLNPATWRAEFDKSGRMRKLLHEVSVYVVLNQKAPLLGASYYACLSI